MRLDPNAFFVVSGTHDVDSCMNMLPEQECQVLEEQVLVKSHGPKTIDTDLWHQLLAHMNVTDLMNFHEHV